MSRIVHKLHRDDLVKRGAKVLDLGGRDGKHSLDLLTSRDAHVTLVDKEPLVGEAPNLKVVKSDLRDYKIVGKYDVVLLNNVLPFLDTKEEAEKVLHNAMKHLYSHGVLVVSFFGKRHEWAEYRLTHTKKELEEMFKDYGVYFKEESEGFITNMRNERTFFHRFEYWLIK